MHILVKNGTLGWKMCLQIKREEKLKFCLWRKMTNMRMPLNKRVIFVCVFGRFAKIKIDFGCR